MFTQYCVGVVFSGDVLQRVKRMLKQLSTKPRQHKSVEAWHHAPSNLALSGGLCLASCPSHFTPRYVLSLPTEQQAGWNPEMVWTFRDENIVLFLLGNSPVPEFYMPTFRNAVPSS